MTVQMIRSYEELVAEGREAREQADSMQWVEGDLALEVEALPGDERPRHPETGLFLEDEAKTLQRYAEDVGLAYRTLQEYRRVSIAWPLVTRACNEASWRVHCVLAAQEDRFTLIRPGMTVREAEKIVRDRTAASSHPPGWMELIGKAADLLIAADKHLAKVERQMQAKGRTTVKPHMAKKAAEYRDLAHGVADRFDAIAQSGEAA